jgi:hypothetical protein
MSHAIAGNLKHFSLAIFLFFLAFFLYAKNGAAGGIPSDNTVYIYWGQQFLSGKLPYISLFDQKGPGTGFITSIFILIGRLLGNSDDVHSIMTGMMLNNALAALMIFSFARLLTGNLSSAFIAYGVFLMCYPLAVETSRAPEPKALVMMFQLLILHFAVRSRWFISGMICMFAMFIWQPCIVLIMACGLLLLRYKHGMRDYLTFAAGLAVPFILFVVLYASIDGVTLLLNGLIGFNYYDYTKPAFKPLGNLAIALNKMMTWFPHYNWLMIISGSYFLFAQPFYASSRLTDKTARRYASALRYGIALWLAWAAFDYGFHRLFIFVPYGAIGFSLLFSFILKNANAKLYAISGNYGFAWAVLTAIIIAVFYTQLPIGARNRLPAQQEMANEIYAKSHQTSDVLACGALPYNVLTRTTNNYNPYDILLRDGNVSMNHFIDRTHPGKRQALTSMIMGKKPTLIVSASNNACYFVLPEQRQEWNEWLESNYQKYVIQPNDLSPKDSSMQCLACWPLPDGKGPILYYIRNDMQP